MTKSHDAGQDLVGCLRPYEWLGGRIARDQIEADRILELSGALVGPAPKLFLGQEPEPALSQANAKLVYRTVLTVDDPEGAQHVVPLKLRRPTNPLYRRVRNV